MWFKPIRITRPLWLYGDKQMSRTVYVNGSYLPEADATISIFDRGFLMADGVYEVTSVLDGKLIDMEGHVVRLARSLAELEMASPISDDDLTTMFRELVNDRLRNTASLPGLADVMVTMPSGRTLEKE